jgi:hypothetical protein
MDIQYASIAADGRLLEIVLCLIFIGLLRYLHLSR